MNRSNPLLRLRRVSKSYSTPVLTNLDLELFAGEVHALVGENGAGKSTLARILAGLLQPDTGEIQLEDVPYRPRNKRQAERCGIRLIRQELNLIGNLTVAENIFFDGLPQHWGWIDYSDLHAQAEALMTQVGLEHVPADSLVKLLGVGQQQLIEIAAGLSRPCKVLVLDEPTAALTVPEIHRLFTLIRNLREHGTAIVYISHRLEEVLQLADQVTILRDGQIVASRPVEGLSVKDLVRGMVGRDLGEWRVAKPKLGPPALRVRNLSTSSLVRQVSFEVRQGEIVGLAGLMGSGRTETLRAIFGADPREAGEIWVGAANKPARIRSPSDAVRHGMALLTEDRKAQGLFLPLSVQANLTLAALAQTSFRRTWIDETRERILTEEWARVLSLRYTSSQQAVSELSGGNQQKVILARWLLRDCEVFLFDEPTRGIDIGAKFDIYRLLVGLAERGKGILVVSSELQELLSICHRILVMSAGRLAGSFQAGEADEERIMAAAVSGYAPATSELL